MAVPPLLFQLYSFWDPLTKTEIVELVTGREVSFIVFLLGFLRNVFLEGAGGILSASHIPGVMNYDK